MDTALLHPIVFGIDHDHWRPHQYESVKWIQSRGGTILFEAPVGSGKTAIATAAGHERKSIAIVRTKFLQDQYGSDYKWNVVKGKSNYPCIHYDNPKDSTAEQCLCPNDMDSCEFANECPYLLAKFTALMSKKVNCNYQLWLTSRYLRDWKPHFTILDECHDLPKIVLEFVGCEVTQSDKQTYELPDFPKIESDRGSLLTIIDHPSDALSWLHGCMDSLDDLRFKVSTSGRHDKKEFLDRIDKFSMKLCATIAGLDRQKFDWYIRSGPEALRDGCPGFIAKPLTARHHFSHLFNTKNDLMLMSATIGNMGVFAAELGIDEYHSMSVESNWKPEVRPVHVLDAPKMGVSAVAKNPKAFDHQAEVISKFIKQYPDDWHGLILVTRRSEAQELTTRLCRNGLSYRIWPFPLKSTDEQLASWEVQKRRHKGQIGISWSTWEGFNGLDERILVIAKVPFGSLGAEGSYDRERMYYDPKFYRLEASLKLEQGCGRIRRGRPEDYDLSGVTKAVAIADGDLPQVKKYLSKAFTESLVTE